MANIFVCRVNQDLTLAVTFCLDNSKTSHTCTVHMHNVCPKTILAVSPEQRLDLVSYARDMLLHRTVEMRFVTSPREPNHLPGVSLFIGDLHMNTFFEMEIKRIQNMMNTLTNTDEELVGESEHMIRSDRTSPARWMKEWLNRLFCSPSSQTMLALENSNKSPL